MLNFSPRLRDTLARGFLIGEGIAHAKAAKGAKAGKEEELGSGKVALLRPADGTSKGLTG